MEQVAPFLTLLSRLPRPSATPEGPNSTEENAAAEPEGPPEAGAQVLSHASAILARLREADSIGLNDLRSAVALPLTDFTEALNALTQAQLIEVEGQPGDEIVRLSRTGAILAAS